MLDALRLYRAAFVPLLFALAIAAFSLSDRPRPLVSTLAPDAFDGARAFADLGSLAAAFPSRRPGSPGDEALAEHISQTLRGLGGTAGGGFLVRTRRFDAQTTDGERTLSTVLAERPGTSSERPIAILAHRDAAARGSEAELSGTAVLLELARVFAQSETRRTIVLVSSSAGGAGAAGAADFAAHVRSQFDAAIVLGDLAGVRARKPFAVPFSDGLGSAPVRLQRTVTNAIAQEVGADPGAPSLIGQLAHLTFPFTVGEQGPLDALHSLPAVLVQVSGERGPAPREPVSEGRLEGFGRSVLSAVDALDAGPDVTPVPETGVLVEHKIIPEWALRLLVAALLLGPLLAAVDGLARARRRREPVGASLLWALACGLPFFLCALFALLLGKLGVIAAPSEPSSALAFDGSAAEAVLAVGLVLVLAWLAWPGFVRRLLGVSPRPSSDAAGVSMLLVLLGVCTVVWVFNPFTALLLVPALHLWLALALPAEVRPRPSLALALVALALAPLALLIFFYAHQLGFGFGGVAWTAVLLLAGGHIGLPGAALWSLAFGCTVAAAMIALGGTRTADGSPPGKEVYEPRAVRVRGPASYAGPGSLGGTESALRR
jgi:hypothetical protein